MKNKNLLKWLIASLVIGMSAITFDGYAQVETKRLPDGTIIYSDGSIKLPNGQMRYPKRRGETTRLPDGTVVYPDGRTEQGSSTRKGSRQPDGSIIYPDGRVRLPDGRIRYPDGTVRFPNSRNKNVKRLPPGQAKKVYGGRATDYAPGQIKGKKDKHDKDDDRRHRDHDDDDDNNGKGKKNKEFKGNKKGKK
jgi:hypothetical protein